MAYITKNITSFATPPALECKQTTKMTKLNCNEGQATPSQEFARTPCYQGHDDCISMHVVRLLTTRLASTQPPHTFAAAAAEQTLTMD